MLGCVLAGCGSSPEAPPRFTDNHHSRFQTGRPNYRVGPYQVNGVWYYPKADYNYDETGTASWYGPGFDHRATADGEIYDMNQLSAAHKTLPLPSVVMVTNLRNGRALRLRVNDRGPFVGDRLIDVSRRAAQLLGFEMSGTTPVRVKILKDESIQVAEAAMRGEYGPVGTGAAVAVAAPAAPAQRTEVAAARPAPAPVRVAAALPPPRPAAPPPVIQALPLPSAAPPLASVAVTPPPEPSPPDLSSPEPPPPVAVAAAPRHYWPSLIARAHAETLHLPPAAPRPAAAAAEPHSGRIFVQAGAFAVPEHARKVRSRIAALGSTEIVPATVNGLSVYRVRLGPVASEAQARRLLDRVVGSGYPGARVVAD